MIWVESAWFGLSQDSLVLDQVGSSPDGLGQVGFDLSRIGLDQVGLGRAGLGQVDLA